MLQAYLIYRNVGSHSYCSSVCTTGACGARGNVVWGANSNFASSAPTHESHTHHNVVKAGWCQPCNTCLTQNTYNGGECPERCRGPAPQVKWPTLLTNAATGAASATVKMLSDSSSGAVQTLNLRAPGVTSRMSSTYLDGTGERATDGVWTTNAYIYGEDQFACLCTDGDEGTWVEFDLGRTVEIVGLTIAVCNEDWCSADGLTITVDGKVGVLVWCVPRRYEKLQA